MWFLLLAWRVLEKVYCCWSQTTFFLILSKLGVKIIAPFFKWLYNKDNSIFCNDLFWIWKYSYLALNWHKIRFLSIFIKIAVDLERRTPTIFDFQILTLLWPHIKFWVFFWFSWFWCQLLENLIWRFITFTELKLRIRRRRYSRKADSSRFFRNNQICQADAWISRHFQKKCNISFIFNGTPIRLSRMANYSIGFSKQSNLHHHWLIFGSLAPSKKLAEILSLSLC